MAAADDRAVSWVAAPAPESEDSLRLTHRAATALGLVGALTCAAGAFTVARTADAREWQLAIASALALFGLIVAAAGPGRRLATVVPPLGSLLLAALIARTQPLGLAPFFELWPIVFGAYFSSRRVLWGSFTLMSATLAVALAVNPHIDTRLDTWLGTTMTVGLMALLVAKMQARAARLHAELSAAALTDSLTGALNRRGFLPRLLELAETTRATGTELALVAFDLDHFKYFNDTHGHLAGDTALQRVAAALTRSTRDGDVVARLGGEEFAVALPACDLTGARAFCDRVAEHLRDGADRPVTTSAGVALLGGEDAPSAVGALLAQADEALYAAKDGGRSRAAWWCDGDVVIGDADGGIEVAPRQPRRAVTAP